MIIYGTRGFRKNIGYTKKPYTCNRCKHEATFVVMQEWMWFTLFFIPLIPLCKYYYIVCPHCNGMAKINKKDLPSIMKQI